MPIRWLVSQIRTCVHLAEAILLELFPLFAQHVGFPLSQGKEKITLVLNACWKKDTSEGPGPLGSMGQV